MIGTRGPVGVLAVLNRVGTAGRFTADDLELLGALAGHVAISVENARLVGDLHHQARHDPLTGLPNRTVLAERVDAALSIGYQGQPSGRVREVPDRRAIRYYTTLGLLDRPAEMRGRTALYGRRHLLQLVAIKRLQARGLNLAEIQERLLARLAQLPGKCDPPTAAEPSAEPAPERRSAAFWAAAPSTVDETPVIGKSRP
jgi:hypothetical protein